jgi:hypothetical protein
VGCCQGGARGTWDVSRAERENGNKPRECYRLRNRHSFQRALVHADEFVGGYACSVTEWYVLVHSSHSSSPRAIGKVKKALAKCRTDKRSRVFLHS